MRDPKDYAGLVERLCREAEAFRLAAKHADAFNAEELAADGDFLDLAAAAISGLTARLAEAEKALGPFAEFGRDNTNADGWMSNIHREAISTWFGPSDFRRAALTSGGGE